MQGLKKHTWGTFLCFFNRCSETKKSSDVEHNPCTDGANRLTEVFNLFGLDSTLFKTNHLKDCMCFHSLSRSLSVSVTLCPAAQSVTGINGMGLWWEQRSCKAPTQHHTFFALSYPNPKISPFFHMQTTSQWSGKPQNISRLVFTHVYKCLKKVILWPF